jgi:uncharacterized protein
MAYLNTQEHENLKEKILFWIKQQDTIDVGIIFGSLSRNQMRAESDVDLAILGEKKFSIEELINMAQELGLLIQRTIDLIDLSANFGLVAKQILTTGILIKNTNANLFAKRIKNFYLDEADYGILRDKAYKARRERVFGKE